MALTIKQKFVIEELFDENGKKLGELKFNPNDNRIMAKMSKIIKDLESVLKQVKDLGDIPELTDKKIKTIEEFEAEKDSINLICKGIDLEQMAFENVINDLSDIFGKETIDIFTGGTVDIDAVMPIIEFVMPYVKNASNQRVSKYIKKKDVEEFVLE